MASKGPQHKIELAPDLYPELNATLYASDPAGYFRLRTTSLLLMLTDEDHLAPVYEAKAEIGALRVHGGTLPDRDDRERFVAMESTVLFHHATETLLRLFFAHQDSPECPWLQVVGISTPKEFKEQSERLIQRGLDRTEVAKAFLGGTDPVSAAIDITQDEFEAGIDAYIELITHCAIRYLDDSFVYNSAKHGLSGVPLSGMKMRIHHETDADPIDLMAGMILASLQKKATPTQKDRKHQAEWYTAMTNVLIDQDLLLVDMIGRSIDSLWAVAKRQYVGIPGSINVFDKRAVQAIIFEPVRAAGQHIRAVVYELPTIITYRNGKTKTSELQVNLHPSLIPREYATTPQPEEDYTIYGTPKSIPIPLRPQDIRSPRQDGKYLLPYSPVDSR